jgi:hypothetical protein
MLLFRSFVLPLDYHRSQTFPLLLPSGSLLLQSRQHKARLSSKRKWWHIQSGRMRSTVSHLVYCNSLFECSVELHFTEFWRIRGLIQSTARSIRRRTSKSQHRPLTPSRRGSSSDSETTEDPPDSQPQEVGYSLKSDGTDEDSRHFLLVFFDVLHIEDQSLLDEPYEKRRQKLEEIVQVIDGFVRFVFSVPRCIFC